MTEGDHSAGSWEEENNFNLTTAEGRVGVGRWCEQLIMECIKDSSV